MFNTSPQSRQAVPAARGACRTLTAAELIAVLVQLDRVVVELEESLRELALPLDEASRGAARDAIAAARRR